MIEAFGASGELSGYDFAKLIIYLNDIRFSGKAIITIGEITKSLFLNEGKIAYSISNDPKDRLGEVMRKYGMLSDDHLAQITRLQESEKKTFGKLVIELGYVTSEDLLQASGLQVKEIIKSLPIVEEFSYFLKKEILPKDIPDLNINPYQILFDSLLEIDDEEWINKQLETEKRIFKLSDDFVDRYRHLLFSAETDIIVAKVNGKDSIETILSSTELDRKRVKSILATLFLFNMLKIVSDSPIDEKTGRESGKDTTQTQFIRKETTKKTPPYISTTQEIEPASSEKTDKSAQLKIVPAETDDESEIKIDIPISTQIPDSPAPEPSAPKHSASSLAEAIEQELDSQKTAIPFQPAPEPPKESMPHGEQISSPPEPALHKPETDFAGKSASLPSATDINKEVVPPLPSTDFQKAETVEPHKPQQSDASLPDIPKSQESIKPPMQRPSSDFAKRSIDHEIEHTIPEIQKITTENDRYTSRPLPPRWDNRPSKEEYLTMLRRRRRTINRSAIVLFIIFLLIGGGYAIYVNFLKGKVELPWETDSSKSSSSGSSQKTKQPVKETPKTGTQITTTSGPKSISITTVTTTQKTTTTGTLKPQMKTTTKPVTTADDNILASLSNRTLSLMQKRDYYNAAQIWMGGIKNKSMYTISIEIACSLESIDKIYSYDKKLNYLFLFPKSVNNRNCFRVCWGIFTSLEEARKGIKTLPAYYQNQKPSPNPVMISNIL